MRNHIVAAAEQAFKSRLSAGSVSDHTRNANEIARAWKTACVACAPQRMMYEVPISPGLNQRIDLVDRNDWTAYEYKVSGKNAYAEFYKDIIKVLMWNDEKQDKIKKLVFITEAEHGRKHLETEMPRAYIKYLKKHGLEIEVVYIEKR